MKRSRQESSDTIASGFLFATDSNVSPSESDSTTTSKTPEDFSTSEVVSPRKRAKKSSKTPAKVDSNALVFDLPIQPDVETTKAEDSETLFSTHTEAQETEVLLELSAPAANSFDAQPQAESVHAEPHDFSKEKSETLLDDFIESESKKLDTEPEVIPPKALPDDNSRTNEEDSLVLNASVAVPVKDNLKFSDPNESAQLGNSYTEERKPSSYQVVARRYRPQLFGELIGQETVARALSNAIETNRVGHAYLFTGARGVGKTSCARIFAKALNCVNGPTTHPCLKCDSCVGIATGDDVDVIEIDGASNRGVDEIRLLRQNATIAPTRSTYKIYIIDEVHMLTREAFNALLKTLEEPPARVKFIFCTTEPNKIPITILSRCQRFDFSGINGNSISERLSQIAQQEGAQAEEGVFDIIARRANGSMRDAQSLLEQLLSFAPSFISQSDVHNMLGSVDDKKIFDLLDATVQSNASKAFELLGEAADQGVDFGVLIEQILGVYRDLMVIGSGCGAKELMYSPVARLSELQVIAQTFGLRRILASIQILDQTSQRMRASAQSRILAELAFARLCQLDAFQTIESLIVQLKRGALPNVQLSSNPSDGLPDESGQGNQKKNEYVNIQKAVEKTSAESVPLSCSQQTPSQLEIPPIEETNLDNPPQATPNGKPKKEERTRRVKSESSSVSSTPDTAKKEFQSKDEPSVLNDRSENNPVLGDSDISSEVTWLSYSENQLCDYWQAATHTGVVLPNHAGMFATVRTEAPNVFIVVFPADYEVQRNYCENEKEKIAAVLSKKLRSNVDLRLILDPTVSPRQRLEESTNYDRPVSDFASAESSCLQAVDQSPRQYDAPRSNSKSRQGSSKSAPQRGNFHELIREFEQDDLVQELKELFEAEVSEVSYLPPSTSKPEYYF